MPFKVSSKCLTCVSAALVHTAAPYCKQGLNLQYKSLVISGQAGSAVMRSLLVFTLLVASGKTVLFFLTYTVVRREMLIIN